jgi:oxygen-dependent protoporphyrinogen oxidase
MTAKTATEGSPAHVRIVGAGISGLVVAHALLRLGALRAGDKLEIQDARNRVGGCLAHSTRDGFLLEHGAQGVLSSREAFTRLCSEAGLASECMGNAPTARARYLITPPPTSAPTPPHRSHEARSRLVRLSPPLWGLVRSGLMGWRAWARALFEWRVTPARPPDARETLYGFFARRFGEAFALRLAVPMATGIWAGGARKLLVRRAFPRLVAWEHAFGSVTAGALRALIGARHARKRLEASSTPQSVRAQGLVSFPAGMGTLPKGLAASIERSALAAGVDLHWLLSSPLASIDHDGSRPRVDDSPCDALVLAFAPWTSPDMAWNHAASRAAWRMLACGGIDAHGVAVVGIGGWIPEDFPAPRGFGSLAADESDGLLGVLNVHDIYPAHVPSAGLPGTRAVLYRILLGGDRAPGLVSASHETLVARALAECMALGILPPAFTPTFTDVVAWEGAIAVMDAKHDTTLPNAWQVEALAPGVVLTGNWISGVGVADCIAEGERAAERVAQRLAGTREVGLR